MAIFAVCSPLSTQYLSIGIELRRDIFFGPQRQTPLHPKGQAGKQDFGAERRPSTRAPPATRPGACTGAGVPLQRAVCLQLQQVVLQSARGERDDLG